MNDLIRPEVLISRLTSPNETWRVDAETRLISLGPQAVEPLVAALHHASPAVRLHAVHALARIRDPRGIPAVIHALEEKENLGAVAIAAEKALIAWGEPVKPALLEAATRGPEEVRPRALRALGRIGGEDLAGPLTELLGHAAPAVRTQAAVALAHSIGERSISAIAPLLTDEDKWVRYGVAEALVSLGSVKGEAVLREAAEDPEEQGQHVQFWAEDLLDQIDELRRTGRVIDG
jgi:bilin biosynthesis protein